MNERKIYTRKGDSGETSLIGGERVSKDHLRIEAYGTLDELNSWIGLLRDGCDEPLSKQTLQKIQEHLFVAESLLAMGTGSNILLLPVLKQENILMLETEIDRMQAELPEINHFILPGGHSLSSQAHIARCVCRRAERGIIRLTSEFEIDEMVLPYINRLSDYLFVLARYINLKKGETEIFWKG